MTLLFVSAVCNYCDPPERKQETAVTSLLERGLYVAEKHALFPKQPVEPYDYLQEYLYNKLMIIDYQEYAGHAITLINWIENSSPAAAREQQAVEKSLLQKLGEGEPDPAWAYALWTEASHSYVDVIKTAAEELKAAVMAYQDTSYVRRAVAMLYTDYFFWGDRRV
jgi:hypothetical protein